jgi:crotonobetainyl-CoA:carnitine CoA-transferase CaiB-like acyl-CoA transferase
MTWAPAQRGGALSGLRVVDTATLYAAPYISTLLADHGADVIKVEPPGGDDYRHFPTRMWPILSRGKRSIVLDLRSDEGCDALRALLVDHGADVVVFNLPPTTLAKRGLDYETLHVLNPALIVVQMTGYGLGGPYSDRPGNGTLGEAFGGLTHMTGDPDGGPVLASVPLGDALTGYSGAFGVLAACYHRLANGGEGQLIDVNPVDVVLQAIGPVITSYDGAGPVPTRMANRLPGSTLRNTFPTVDGEWVAISASMPRHAEEFAALSGHQDFTADGRPSGDLDGSVRGWTSTQTRADILREAVTRRLPVTPVNSVQDLIVDEHILARGNLLTIDTSDQGPVMIAAPAPRLLGTPAPHDTRTATVGEHDEEILGPR